MNYKKKFSHRLLALALAAVMCCTSLPIGVFAETPPPQESAVAAEEQQTDETETDNGQTDASSPDPGAATEESAAPTTDESAEENEPYTFDGEVLYQDMPHAPTGSYIGSYGLPVATGETKIGLGAWDADLEQDSYLSAEALDSDNMTLAAPLLEDTDYAIVPILAQVEYPADGSSLDLILPDSVTLLDYYGEPAKDAESLLHSEYSETSAAALGVYVQADADFTAQLVYTVPDGSTLTKTLQVTIDRNATAEYPFPDSEIAAFAERPTPAVTSGKITKVAKVNSTWLIWFNGEPSHCCTHGAKGQPEGCPTYTYVDTSTVNADQCVPGDHYGNQIRIWGGLNQLSLGDADDLPAVFSADEGEEISLLDFCASIYDDVQMYIIENFPESTTAEIYLASADELLNGVETYASARGYYTYIYNPGRAGWQTVALIGPEIGEEEPEPEPVVQEYYASWEAPAQTASGSFDFSYGVRTDKIQTATLEKVDGATIEIEPTTKSGSIEGGNWSISPAGKQTVTTSGHTADDNYQKNGGDASASWSLHYAVTKTSGTRNGQVGPFTTQEAADAAANSARDAAIAELQGEAQNAVNNAIAAAKAQLGSIQFRYEEITVPYGFGKYWGTNGSSQTISVPANTNNDYVMKNDEWSLQVNLKKTDSETGSQIATDAQYEIYQWDVVTGKYQPTGGYNTYSVQRQGDGSYAVINSAAYATTDSMRHTLYYTQRNAGKFIIVESKAPTGYFGDWTDINHPGIVNTPLGKRGYYIEITEDSDNSVIWLDNADYNADIAATDKGGTKLVTSTGVETTVTIYDTGKDSSRTFNTDNSGKAANEDSYTITPSDGVMKNDRTLGEISISKVDLDAVRYVGGSAAHGTALASGQAHGDAALDGAVYDLYAAEDITHPDGVTGVVDYSKIVDADGNPIWHTTIRDNSGQWVSDYLPVLKKDHLVASAKIENGWLCFSNLYLGKYYVVERSTGVVIPLRDGALAVSGTYPTVDSRTKAVTGQTAALAKNGSGQYTDWVYKNQFSTVSKGKALDGSWTYDAYYLSFADGYLYFDCDIPIRGEQYGSSTHKDAATNSGKYIIEEIRAPLGYYVNEEPMEVTFTYDGQTVRILESTCTDKPTEMWVSKRDLTNDEELPGATLTIQDMDGNIVESWVSTDTPHRVTGLHLGDAYTLTETRPADGYALADEITFRLLQKVDEDGSNLQEAEAYYLTKKSLLFWTWDDWKLLDDATVIMRDDTIKAEFSKKDLTTMEELPGAELTITDKDGKEIDRWVSSDKPHYIEKLPAGDYTLTEVKAPDGYAFAESVPFTALPTGEVQQFEMLDDVIKVEISKKDLTTMEELPGAELTLTDKGGTVVEHWTSTDKPHYIEKLPAGDYTLTEVKAPDGYAFAESVPFTVLPTGEVQRFEMLDDVIKVEISKVDITTNKELPGAELIITNKDGKVVEHWTSTDKPHYIEKLPAGEYTLTEITAPNGYEIAEDIPFTVLPTGEVQRVVMKDAPIPEQPVQPTPPTTPTPTPLIPQTGDTFPLGLLLALAGLSLAGLAALIFKCVHCKAVAQKDDDETE